jgi:hypothetical protein
VEKNQGYCSSLGLQRWRALGSLFHFIESSTQIYTAPKIRNKYSKKWNCEASFQINICIHVSVIDLYIPTIGRAIFLYCIWGPIVVINKQHTDTWI